MPDQSRRPTRAGFHYWWPVTVRWGDMDALGHVNNMVHFQYVESARVGYFETAGWNGGDASTVGHGPAVVSQTCNYRQQLRYPAEIEVGLECTEIRGRSFVLAFAIFRKESDELFSDGSCILVWLDNASGRAMEIPPAIRERLRESPSAAIAGGEPAPGQ